MGWRRLVRWPWGGWRLFGPRRGQGGRAAPQQHELNEADSTASPVAAILYKLKLGQNVTTIPTVGFNVETVTYKNVKSVDRARVGYRIRQSSAGRLSGAMRSLYVVSACH